MMQSMMTIYDDVNIKHCIYVDVNIKHCVYDDVTKRNVNVDVVLNANVTCERTITRCVIIITNDEIYTK